MSTSARLLLFAAGLLVAFTAADPYWMAGRLIILAAGWMD